MTNDAYLAFRAPRKLQTLSKLVARARGVSTSRLYRDAVRNLLTEELDHDEIPWEPEEEGEVA